MKKEGNSAIISDNFECENFQKNISNRPITSTHRNFPKKLSNIIKSSTNYFNFDNDISQISNNNNYGNTLLTKTSKQLYDELMSLKRKVNILNDEISIAKSNRRKKDVQLNIKKKEIESYLSDIKMSKDLNPINIDKLIETNIIGKLKKEFYLLKNTLNEIKNKESILRAKLKKAKPNILKQSNIILENKLKSLLQEYYVLQEKNKVVFEELEKMKNYSNIFAENHKKIQELRNLIEEQERNIYQLKENINEINNRENINEELMDRQIIKKNNLNKKNIYLENEIKNKKKIFRLKINYKNKIEKLTEKKDELEQKFKSNERQLNEIKENIKVIEKIKQLDPLKLNAFDYSKIKTIEKNPDEICNSKVLLLQSLITESINKKKNYQDLIESCTEKFDKIGYDYSELDKILYENEEKKELIKEEKKNNEEININNNNKYEEIFNNNRSDKEINDNENISDDIKDVNNISNNNLNNIGNEILDKIENDNINEKQNLNDNINNSKNKLLVNENEDKNKNNDNNIENIHDIKDNTTKNKEKSNKNEKKESYDKYDFLVEAQKKNLINSNNNQINKSSSNNNIENNKSMNEIMKEEQIINVDTKKNNSQNIDIKEKRKEEKNSENNIINNELVLNKKQIVPIENESTNNNEKDIFSLKDDILSNDEFSEFTYILIKNLECKKINEEIARQKIIIIPTKENMEKNLFIEQMSFNILKSIHCDNKDSLSKVKTWVSTLLNMCGNDQKKTTENFLSLFNNINLYNSEQELNLSKKIKKAFLPKKEIIFKKLEPFQNKYISFHFLKQLIEEQNIDLKDEYAQFLFYELKKYDDPNASLYDLKAKNLLDIIENTQNDSKMDTESDIEITNEQYVNIITNFGFQLLKYLDANKTTLRTVLGDLIQNLSGSEDTEGDKMEVIFIEPFVNKMKEIGIILNSEVEIYCLFSRYKLSDEYEIISLNLLEKELENFKSYNIKNNEININNNIININGNGLGLNNVEGNKVKVMEKVQEENEDNISNSDNK